MTAKLDAADDVVGQAIDAMACCVKLLVPDELAHRLDALYPPAFSAARRMLRDRRKSSSKFWKEIPCVVAKSLIAKYQRNPRCKRVSRIVIPVCGDKGRQIKLEGVGIRVPALFGRAVLPVSWLHRPVGPVRSVEFYRRSGRWFGSVCINAACASPIQPEGCIGVDRNMRGNIAVLADPQTGAVRHLGFDASRTKHCWRQRKARLQHQGRRRLLHQVRRKQSRRTTYENHSVSKQIVDYATLHRRCIVLENLDGVQRDGSKIKHPTQKGQWAFAQLESFIRYKAALRGVPVIGVNPAYTSQTCSRCGSRHKPDGKSFRCPDCGHVDHRDANAAFCIGIIGAKLCGLSAPQSGPIGGAASGKRGAQ